MITIDEWLAHMEKAETSLVPSLEFVVREAAHGMSELAKSYIGHEQGSVSITSPIPHHIQAWEPLAVRTLEDKRRMGITADDGAPLYRTGQMKISIRSVAAGLTGAIGSDDPVAVWQELGTSKIPPRPFLARGVIEGLPVLEILLVDVARVTLIPMGAR